MLATPSLRSSPAPLCAPPSPIRTFEARDGQLWHVCERTAPAEIWARHSSYLLFESGCVLRRVWHFPHDWADLPDEELEAICERRA